MFLVFYPFLLFLCSLLPNQWIYFTRYYLAKETVHDNMCYSENSMLTKDVQLDTHTYARIHAHMCSHTHAFTHPYTHSRTRC